MGKKMEQSIHLERRSLPIKFWQMKNLIHISTLCLLALGCATTPPPSPVSISEVISMSKDHVWEDDIIRKIATTRTVFHLGAEDIVRLHKEGVNDHVINYMIETHTKDAVSEQRRQDSYYYYSGFYYAPYRRHYWR